VLVKYVDWSEPPHRPQPTPAVWHCKIFYHDKSLKVKT